jgi:hypothetical protein
MPASRRVQQPPSVAPTSFHPTPLPSTDPSRAHMVFEEMPDR